MTRALQLVSSARWSWSSPYDCWSWDESIWEGHRGSMCFWYGRREQVISGYASD